MLSLRASVAAAALILAAPATAAELSPPSRIERVTVFPDAALVTRVVTVDLPAGASTLALRGLPASIDPESIRVEGRGSALFAIGAVDLRLQPGDPQPVLDAALEARLLALREEREAVAGQERVQELKRQAIRAYAETTPDKLGVENKPFEPAQWVQAWSALATGLGEVEDALRSVRQRARTLDAEIAALDAARPRPPRAGAPRRDAVVAVEAREAVEGELRVTYRVAGASWQPSYDARLDTGAKDRKPQLTLARRAQVSQRTGEDWTDVELAVSTVRLQRGTAAPELAPLQVQFRETQPVPPPPAPRASAPMAMLEDRAAGENVASARRSAQAAEVAQLQEAQRQSAVLEAGGFQATFRVPGRVSVPQDGAGKSLLLAERGLAPGLHLRTTPELDETAYLEASFVNEEEAPLLPGPVWLHRDGTYVGRGRLKLVPTGEAVELGFGADDRVKVARVPLRRRESEPGWIGSTRQDLREFKITLRNLHPQPMRVTVLERLPFTENAAITVEPLREATPPTERQVGDRRGVMAYAQEIAPGETKEIRTGYRLRWPADRDLAFEPRPVR